jgi:membrane-associated phospholipid phosphatase
MELSQAPKNSVIKTESIAKRSWKNLLAVTIASILHPATLILPAVFLIVYKSAGKSHDAFLWTFISLLFSGIVAAFVLLGVKRGFFSDIDVSIKSQRIILYPFVVAITLLFTGFIYLFHGPTTLIVASILFVVALIILDVINIRIKASVHVASVAAIVVGIIYLYGGASFFLILLIPLVAWARVYEKRHTIKETIVGAACGIAFTVAAILVVQLII